MRDAVIFNIQKFSVHDGPGIRSIVFFKGCPLSCEWCANPESNNEFPEIMYYPNKCIGCKSCITACGEKGVWEQNDRIFYDRNLCVNCGSCAKACPTKARELVGKVMSLDTIIEEVDKDIPFYKNSGGGITFSGGEPMMYPEYIREISRHYHEYGLTSAVETCGHVPWERFQDVADYVDLMMFDLKFADTEKHMKYCGADNKLILENMKKVVKLFNTIIRIPIIPGINDTDKEIGEMGLLLGEIIDDIQGVHCLPYHNYAAAKYEALGRKYKLQNVELPDEAYMNHIKSKFLKQGIDIQIGG